MKHRICSLLRMKPPVQLNRGLLIGSGSTVPAEGTDGWQTGAIFQHTAASDTARTVYLNEGSVTSSLFRAIEAGDFGEFASLLYGGGIPISSDDTTNLAVYSDDNDANIAVSCRGLLSRFLLTVDQSAGTIRALQGQLKLATGVDVTTGVYTASQGYVELAGTHSVQTGAQFSCFDASLEIGSALTVDSGGKCAGIYVETTGTGTISNSGQCAGIIVTKASGAASWPTGIAIDGAACQHGILVGSTTDGEGIVMGTTVTKAVGIYAELATDAGSGYNVRPLRARLRVDVGGTVETETYGMQGQVNAYASNLGHWHAGALGSLEGSSGTVQVYNPLAGAAGVIGRIGGTIEITTASFVAGLVALANCTMTVTSGTYAGLYVTKTSGQTSFTHGIYIQGSAVDYGIAVGVHSNTVGSGVTVSNTNKRVAGIYADDNAVGTGGAEFISVLRGRLLMTGSTYLGEQYGLHGTVVYRPAASAAISSWTAGVLGTLEGATGMSVAGYACAVLGRVGFGAMQPTVTGFVAGVFALNNMAAALASGSTSAFLADTVGTTEWTYGLNIQSAATAGILIASTVTTGISITGTTGTGISIGACTTAAINIAAANLNCIKSVFNVSAQLGQYVQGIKMEHTRTANIQPSTGGWWGAQIVLNAGTGYAALDKTAYVLHCVFKGDATASGSGTVNVARFETQSNGKVEDLLFVSANAGSTVEGDVARFVAHAAPTRAILAVQNGTVGSTPMGICVDIDETMTTGIQFNTGAALTNLFQITAAANTSYFLIADAEAGCLPNYSSAGSAIANLKVKIGSTDGYIKIYDAA